MTSLLEVIERMVMDWPHCENDRPVLTMFEVDSYRVKEACDDTLRCTAETMASKQRTEVGDSQEDSGGPTKVEILLQAASCVFGIEGTGERKGRKFIGPLYIISGSNCCTNTQFFLWRMNIIII